MLEPSWSPVASQIAVCYHTFVTMGKNAVSIPHALWETPVQFVRGVGPKKAGILSRLGIHTAEDLLWYTPRRYEDRSTFRNIADLRPGEERTIIGEIEDSKIIRTRRSSFTIVEVVLCDGGARLKARWFNQAYLANTLKKGRRVMVNGMVREGRRGWDGIEMESPVFELVDTEEGRDPLHVGRIVPVYPETRGISSRIIRSVVDGLLNRRGHEIVDALPAPIRERLGLLPLQIALRHIHFPDEDASLERLNRGITDAHQRLAFDELFLLELGLGVKNVLLKERETGIAFRGDGRLAEPLRRALPFSLMKAQERVISEILHDMASPYPMNRLIQGDVGCGKTIVALFAMVNAVESGYQSAVMAPTEILAEQHYLNLRAWLEPLGLHTVLLVSGLSKSERQTALEHIAGGTAHVVIGTHALIQADVQFHRLGLAVIDEQHKFGVLQRAMLKAKGHHPDILVMTATPIPRTLALTLYGDLDVSVIETLPPGRPPVRTIRVSDAQRTQVSRMMRDALDHGRQGYIVYPLVEESEKIDLKAAVDGWKHLQAMFPDKCIGLIHGRMKARDKEQVMKAFKAGTCHLLVSTSVIEVGIDVPRATLMLIEHADRFGVAQLHQLRGRIGRGTEPSTCILMATGYESSETVRRLEALVKSSDGFKIAEEDLMIRGPGDFFGTRQWGLPDLRVAHLIRDSHLLERARTEALHLLHDDPHLERPEHLTLKAALHRRWKDKLDLVAVS